MVERIKWGVLGNATIARKCVIPAIRKSRNGFVYALGTRSPVGARELRRYILGRHTRVHSCHISEAGPALGVHLGPGGLVVGFVAQPDQLN